MYWQKIPMRQENIERLCTITDGQDGQHLHKSWWILKKKKKNYGTFGCSLHTHTVCTCLNDKWVIETNGIHTPEYKLLKPETDKEEML